jgi:membrane protein
MAENLPHRFRSKASQAAGFITSGIWRISHNELSGAKALALRSARIMLLSVRGFITHHCSLHASALTFYSLLSIVPVLAMAFGIAKGFGLEAVLEKNLHLRFAGQEEVLNRVIGFAHSLLANTQGGIIAGIGVVVLLWSVVKVMNNIEGSFNAIWNVRSRSFQRKFSDYLSIMLIGPLLFILASSMTVYIRTQITAMASHTHLLQMVSPAITLGLKLLPYVLMWLLFSLIYIVMPNTRVRLMSGLLAGIVAGTAYQLAQLAYITFQIFVAKTNAVYGSFAALPLFLVWLQASWLIVLFGAEISHAHQNVDRFEWDPDVRHMSAAQQKLVALYICRYLILNFEKGEKPATVEHIAGALKLPMRLVERLVADLTDCGILSRILPADESQRAYQPARDIDHLTIQSIFEALDQRGNNNHFSPPLTPEIERLSAALESISGQIHHSAANKPLKDI